MEHGFFSVLIVLPNAETAPVESRQSASDSSGVMCERLSKAQIHPFSAAIIKSRSLDGAPRVAQALGHQ